MKNPLDTIKGTLVSGVVVLIISVIIVRIIVALD